MTNSNQLDSQIKRKSVLDMLGQQHEKWWQSRQRSICCYKGQIPIAPVKKRVTCWRGPFLAYTSPSVAPEMRSVVFEQSLKLVSIHILILISTLHCMKPS